VTALSLDTIVAEELARVQLAPDALPVERSRRTVFAPDLPGFGIRHYWSGRRVYIVQCRMGGRMRTVTIGSVALVGRRAARDVARRVLLRAYVGENPAETRARVRAAPTFGDFLEEYWTRVSPTWKPTTQESQASYRRAYLDSAFPGKFIDEIEQEHVARWFAETTERAGPGGANRAFEILRALMNKAEDWGYRAQSANPCAGVRTNRRRKIERQLSEEELARLGQALRSVGEPFPLQCAALTLLLLTGCRRSEILDLRWSEVKGHRLRLEDSKTGPRTVWLGDQARALIEGLPRRRGEGLVFPLAAQSRRNALNHTWRLVCAEARLTRLRVHDLRHAFASFAGNQSETLPMIGKLLGHAKIATTARYAHVSDDAARDACERIGKLIEELIG
jgi:integrase